MKKIILKSGREKSVLRRHPWIFSGAVDKIENSPASGETVLVLSNKNEPICIGSYSPKSQIRIRVLTFNPQEVIDAEFFQKRISAAIDIRSTLISDNTNAYRIINSENDGLPGVVVDKYGEFLSCQFLSAGAEFWKTDIVNALNSLLAPKGIYERSDASVRLKEGLDPVSGLLIGEMPPDEFEVLENDMMFLVDIKTGHKTGFYIDQRDNRLMLSSFVKDRDVLNCFSYTGGFSVFALAGGASKVTNIDSSADALALADKNILLNEFDPAKSENINDDVFKVLRTFRDSGKSFDVIILDPPKFAESASQIQQASRGYKDINLLAIKLLNPGGTLFTFSCSGHITQDLFGKIVSDAALDSGRDVKIIHHLNQSADHFVSTSFPEGSYLKGLVCKVI